MSTPWINFLQQHGASIDATQPARICFKSPREEAVLAASSTVVVPLTHLGLIHASGDEASSFLQNLGSNDIKKLAPDRAQHNSLNSPKGRMLASFIVWRSDGDYLLALSADLHANILKKLSMYVLRAKVKLRDGGDERLLLGLAGTHALMALEAAGLSAPAETLGVIQGQTRVIHLDGERYILDCAADTAPQVWTALVDAGAQAAGTAAWRWLDIQAGLPLVTAQTQDEFVAQMLNFELLGGVNFQKGCYPGQEIVARTQYLGKLKKRMFRAHVADAGAAQVGTDLYAPEFGAQSCGKVVAAVESPEGGADLLAVMQISAHEAGEVHLNGVDGPRLVLSTLPYAVD
ncbi:folate-binding protein [Uliginosibacterium sp. 31-16]|uniref:CAF17-like 4Fe-4S cluster assembly/insertion protein YgfZ n=1 Tax=Uliginosibacterium sp. 31-16 TaxID=3068315 RepID=UPI00273EC7AC|nr:folate-binding protein [Uliginosibacterium sp. 31-16]MDP5239444.1 folate-binding protein [Uliginosibacterium sp. 31-16]